MIRANDPYTDRQYSQDAGDPQPVAQSSQTLARYQNTAVASYVGSTSRPSTYVSVAQPSFGMKISDALPKSRLQQELAAGQSEHKAPIMVSIPAGPCSLCVGGRLIRSKAQKVELRCKDLTDPRQPCWLEYTVKAEKGAMVGFGAGLYASVTAYAGKTDGESIAIRRRIDNVADRLRIQRESASGSIDAVLRDWSFEPQDVASYNDGDTCEQTCVRTFANGGIFNAGIQRVDVGRDVAAHFIIRTEIVQGNMAVCTLIPVQFRRLTVTVGNAVESYSRSSEESSGSSASVRFRLDDARGMAAWMEMNRGTVPEGLTLGAVDSADPVVLVRRETVTQLTARRSLTLLSGRLGLFVQDGAGTQEVQDAQGTHTTQTTFHDAKKRGWSSIEDNRWEVTSAYDHQMRHGRECKDFTGMLIYQRYALDPGKDDDFLRTDRRALDAAVRLKQKRNADLALLEQQVGCKLPSFDTPQVPCAIGVEVLLMLSPAHVDRLAHITQSQVAKAAEGCNLNRKQTVEALQAFADMQLIEQDSELAKQLAVRDSGGGLINVNVDRRLARDFSLIDQDATARQAQVLQKLLRKPNALRIVTTFLAQEGDLPAPWVEVDCPAYEAAEEGLGLIDDLRMLFVAETDPDMLLAVLQEIRALEKKLEQARAVADCDALSVQYRPRELAASRAAWDDAIVQTSSLREYVTLLQRPDEGMQIMQDPRLIEALSRQQRLGVYSAKLLAPLESNEAKRVAAKLERELEKAGNRVRELNEALHADLPLHDVYELRRQSLLVAMRDVASQPFVEAHDCLRRQIDRLHDVLESDLGRMAVVPATTSTARTHDALAYDATEANRLDAACPPLPPEAVTWMQQTPWPQATSPASWPHTLAPPTPSIASEQQSDALFAPDASWFRQRR